jgi:restriction endonuclease Mrr
MSDTQGICVLEVGGHLPGLGNAPHTEIVPIPGPQPLILPVLRQLADGAEHASMDVRGNIAREFELTAGQLTQKDRSGSTTFVNHVAWTLAWLNQSKAIVKVCEGIYRITVYGIAVLAECEGAQEITLKELRAF